MPEAIPLKTVYEEFDWLVRSLITSPGRDPAEILMDIAASVMPEGVFDSFITNHEHFQTALASVKNHIN
jgi:hypothetical protein